ncbi:MAG: SDR family oxidoreductase [Chloroflexi bacterium]|nr:SDR family oxidoreductase [Chloroflexota bacterium]
MSGLLEDRVAVVTGAGRGIGRAEALALAAQGAKVVVNDLKGGGHDTGAPAAPADEVVEEINGKGGIAVASYDSVATPEGAERIIKTAIDSFGRIDILVNNAGILRDHLVFRMSPEDWDAVIKVHLYGTFYCTRFATPYMVRQRYGRLINTSSEAGLGNPGQVNYSAAKEGIVGFTRSASRELGRFGVTCNAIRPRAATHMTMRPELIAAWEKAGRQDLIKETAAMTPEGVAPLVVFLASEAAENINGCTFLVYRGFVGLYDELAVREKLAREGGDWTPEELVDLIPRTIGKGRVRELPPAF